MKKRNDKGFTLVELIVVLVILAILAAILVPALLGYIDKAREKQVTTNAEAAYVAAQAIATEAYGKGGTVISGAWGEPDVKKIKNLTDIEEEFDVTVGYKNAATGDDAKKNHDSYIINYFIYKQKTGTAKTAVWSLTGDIDGEDVGKGGWKVLSDKETISLSDATSGGAASVTVTETQ